VATLLAAEGAELHAYDPGIDPTVELPGITLAEDAYQAVQGAATTVLLTEWSVFRGLDWSRVAEEMTGDAVVDTRNHLDPEALSRVGLAWHGVGATPVRPKTALPAAT
jgi:UDPglucose 6-dehydrogenase